MVRGFVKVWAHIIRSKPTTTKVLSVRIFSGLGGRLLLAFSLMALLTLSASLLGWIGLTHLRQLEQNRQGFNEQLTGYLAERKQLPNEARAAQQQELLARWFEPGQWRRVEALTRLKQGEPQAE
jgi:hypothetical protein